MQPADSWRIKISFQFYSFQFSNETSNRRLQTGSSSTVVKQQIHTTMANHPFEKFINKAASGAKKKEAIRQEKRKLKKEKREKIEEARIKEQVTSNKKQGKYTVRSTKYEVENSGPGIRKQINTNYKQPETGDRKLETGLMPLNKFIAHAGICARREAAEIVKEGKVKVNNSVVHEPGFKVSSNDKVSVNGRQVFIQENLVYILLNKPKDYITTASDPEGRKTVFDLIKHATKERVYPVGRLDRNTTGVLLMTNDGELAQKLTHPAFEVKKLYEVKLDKPLSKKDFETILKGVTLEDGFVKADALAHADTKDKSIIGIEIHSGRNRIVRRLFEHLHYDVKNLDRVMFANLTKKNVDRGKWRFLNEKEVRLLKYMNQSFVRSKK
jgi:23S rRNA pseudouridine2605 synthase